MNYDNWFEGQLDELRKEGNYRVFADLERYKGNFPIARSHRDGKQADVTVWCSNDYLGMGQNQKVLKAMHDVKAAIRYFRMMDETSPEVYKIDSERIFAGGVSAGAIAAVNAGYLDQYE